MTIIIPSPQLLIHSKNKDYVTQISHREHKTRNLNSNLNSILDDCTINLSLMCFNGVNPAIHQARVYSSVIISDFIDLNNPKNPLFYGSLSASANDFENAIYWYKIAAKRKSVTAMNAIGLIYFNMYQKIRNRCENYGYSNEYDNEEDDEKEETCDNKELFENKFLKYKKDLFYKIDPSKEALKWFYRAYRFGSIQSIQYIAQVYEAIGQKAEALHFYRKHYEKTVKRHNLISKSSSESLNANFNITDSYSYSLYSKYKIGLLFSFFNYNNSSFLWFISCAEISGHLKSVHKMLKIIQDEKNSENKSYDEIYTAFFQNLNNRLYHFEKETDTDKTLDKNIKLAKIISILKFKSIINSCVNDNISTKNNKKYNINMIIGNKNDDDNTNSINNDTNYNTTDKFDENYTSDEEEDMMFKNRYNDYIQNHEINIKNAIYESPICTDTALDVIGWKNLNSMFSADIFSKSLYSQKQQYSSKRLEVPSFKIASHAFWLIDPLFTSSRCILQYDPSLKSGLESYLPTKGRLLNLKSVDYETNIQNSSNIQKDPLLTIHNSDDSSTMTQFTSSFLKLYPPIYPAFFASCTKSQYLNLAFKFASPSFPKRNLQLSMMFLQKIWRLHPKGISESLLFRNKCKSNNTKHIVQCGFISILCRDYKFALDLFTKAAKRGNETGSLMAGLLMYHGLNVLRQVKNGCFYLSQCSTDPIALLHLSLACNDEIYETRAKETLGMYSSSFQYNPMNSEEFLMKNKPKNNSLRKDDEFRNQFQNSRFRMYEWVGDLFSNSVKLPFNVKISLMFYGIALKKAEEDGDEIDDIIKKISLVSREPGFTK